METIKNLVNFVLHLDAQLSFWAIYLGPQVYILIFFILFCETGLVVTPFLPGDSLLFALGALSVDGRLSFPILLALLPCAAFAGDVVNYSIGRYFGEHLFRNPHSKIFRKKYLERTKKFYAKHGGRTIILARFVPIVRTFAPFVAGMAGMKYPRFLLFSIGGAIGWIVLFLSAGYFFGNLPVVKTNFHLVILGVIVISVLPLVYEWWNSKKHT